MHSDIRQTSGMNINFTRVTIPLNHVKRSAAGRFSSTTELCKIAPKREKQIQINLVIHSWKKELIILYLRNRSSEPCCNFQNFQWHHSLRHNDLTQTMGRETDYILGGEEFSADVWELYPARSEDLQYPWPSDC